jgi:exodeoxyribonuclease-3
MKIITRNVNGIRAIAKKWFKEFIEKENADIYCLQEVKAFESQFIEEIGYIKWYNFLWHIWQRPWYAGTAILFKNNLEIVGRKNYFENEMFNEDWRITQIELKVKNWKLKDNTLPNNLPTNSILSSQFLVLLNIYFPNGWTRVDGTEMLSYKLRFYDEITNYCNNLVNSWKNVIIMGDFNICHEKIDIARPDENENSIWFLPIERKKFGKLLDNWYIDTFRQKYPERVVYSWWSYRANARPRNVGWRLDYFVINKEFLKNIIDTKYLTDVMWSDHCPVCLLVEFSQISE